MGCCAGIAAAPEWSQGADMWEGAASYKNDNTEITLITRMYSSGIRTARLLTVSQHALLGGVPDWGVYLAGGCTWLGVVYLSWGFTCQGGLPAGECTYPGGCTCPGGTCPGTPPREQNDRQVQKYYLVPNFVWGR